MRSIIIEDHEYQHFLAQNQQHGPSRTHDPKTTKITNTGKAKATKTTKTSKAKATKTTKTTRTSKAKATKTTRTY